LALWVGGGCCSHPGVFSRLEHSLKSVQAYYEPLVQELAEEPTQEKVRRAVVAADATLLLVGELQAQWCPEASAVRQAALAAATAQQLAAEAGVGGSSTQEPSR
jgi:hypothetical protein